MNNPTNPTLCKDCKFCPYNVNPKFDPNDDTTHYLRDEFNFRRCPMWDDGDSGYGAEWHGELDGWCYRGEVKE